MPNLHDRLNRLAKDFASSVLDVLRGAPLQELLGQEAGTRRGVGRFGSSSSAAANPAVGRLPRRSADDIARGLEKVVSVVSKHPDGLRAEEIKGLTGLTAKELPRILKDGLEKKALKSKGRKRATTYFAK